MSDQGHTAPRRILLCLGPCHGEFYYPLSDGERIGCPVSADHPVAVYETPTIYDVDIDPGDDL